MSRSYTSPGPCRLHGGSMTALLLICIHFNNIYRYSSIYHGNLSFMNKYCWTSESFGIYCRVVKSMSTDISEVRAASIIGSMSEPSAKR
jgi:hypothetical protein